MGWTDANKTDPQGDWGQAADNDNGFGQAPCQTDWGNGQEMSLGHEVTNLYACGGGGGGYKLVFQAEPEYGYVAFTTPLSGIADFDITFKLESFTDGFFVLGRSLANRAISVTSTTVDVRIGGTTYNIPVTGSNLDETLVKRVGSVITVYRTSDLGTPVGSLDTGVTNTMSFDYIGKNGNTANVTNYIEGALRSINVNGLVAYNADQGSGNLNDLIGSNTGILSTQGTAVPIYQPI